MEMTGNQRANLEAKRKRRSISLETASGHAPRGAGMRFPEHNHDRNHL